MKIDGTYMLEIYSSSIKIELFIVKMSQKANKKIIKIMFLNVKYMRLFMQKYTFLLFLNTHTVNK